MTTANISQLSELLSEAQEFFSLHQDVEWWIDCGTLLGIYRDNALIPWEKDIDIGIWADAINEDLKKSFFQYFKEKGCYINIFPDGICIGKDLVVLDIKLYRKEGNNAVERKYKPKNSVASCLQFFQHCLASSLPADFKPTNSPLRRAIMAFILQLSKLVPSKQKKPLAEKLKTWLVKRWLFDITETVPKHFFAELTTIEFENKSFSVPSKIEDYLAFRYTKNWKTPVQDWVTARDDGAFQLTHNEN